MLKLLVFFQRGGYTLFMRKRQRKKNLKKSWVWLIDRKANRWLGMPGDVYLILQRHPKLRDACEASTDPADDPEMIKHYFDLSE